MRGNMLLMATIIAISSATKAQAPTYILQRENYKPVVSSINISPDGQLLLAGFADGHTFYSVSSQGELTRWNLNPEIFVFRYYETPFLEELAADIIARYYQRYLKEQENIP